MALTGATQAQAQTCTSSSGYIFTGNPVSVYEVNITTGVTTLVRSNLYNGNINGIGFNVRDGFYYGYVAGTSNMIKIPGDVVNGTPQVIPVPGLLYSPTGTISQGIHYSLATDPINGSVIQRIDLNGPTPVLLSQLPTTLGAILDIAVSPIDGNIYAFDANTVNTLYRYNRQTGTRTTVGMASGDPISPRLGGSFMDSAGNLYLYNQDQGGITKINAVHTGNTVAAYLVSSGVPTGSGNIGVDAASCVPDYCVAGSTAPTLSATSKANVCPATTADISALVSSTCPTGSSLEWHTVSTGLSATNKVANPATVLAGTYYPVCFDATNTCYSPAPATGVTVTITACCNSGTVAPTLSATTKSNVCPATTADISALISSTCPVGSSLEWHTISTGLSATNKVANPATVLAGTYYPVCFDATNTCYSPVPATGVTVSITTCTSPLSLISPPAQTATPSQLKTGNAATELTPSGGTAPYTYTNGSTDPACVAPSGATALTGVVITPTGTYSYTAPATAGTYYFCVKVCDLLGVCSVKVYQVTVVAAGCSIGTAVPVVN